MTNSERSETRRRVKKILLAGLAVMLVAGVAISIRLTRDGELVTPAGSGTVELNSGSFEQFPLPDYAAAAIDGDYKSYLVEVAPGIKIHMLEVGTGYPVYMQHGLPSSGFLYRNVAAALPLDRFRVIMPTMVGLGFSSKVPASDHTIENHVSWMNSAIRQLDLDGVIFVGHDWGGPIGMGALERSPELIEGAVMLNTILTARTEEESLATPVRIAKTPIVGEVILEGLVSIFGQMPGLQADPDSMPSSVVDLYERPVAESGNGKGPLAILRMAPDSLDHPTAAQGRIVDAYVRSLDIPAEIVWGMNDSLLADRLPDMVALFPNAGVTETSAGHFLQEEGDSPQEIAEAIQRVLAQIQDQPGE